MKNNNAFWCLVGVLGRRPFLSFGLISMLTVSLLAAVNITSRYAMQKYVEDQINRVPWDYSIYQTSEVPLAREIHDRIKAVEHVAETGVIYFLRTILPDTVTPLIDGVPMHTPWLSILSATDPALIPPDIRPSGNGAVLVLVGSKSQMGNAYLNLQGKTRFDLRLKLDKSGAPVRASDGQGDAHDGEEGRSRERRAFYANIPNFSMRLEKTMRIDGTELNRWFMEITSSPTLVPELGIILVIPYNPKLITEFDAISRGTTVDLGDADAHDTGAGEYFPDVIHLARSDRAAILSGWDVAGSLARLRIIKETMTRSIKTISYSAAVDNTSGVMFERINEIAKRIGLISLLVSLPLLWMAWVLLANITGLLLLNERRKLGLLRLRGVPGRLIGRSLLFAIGAGGVAGGVVGAVVGTALPILIYTGGWFPWDILFKVQSPVYLAVFIVISVGMALLVSRRMIRYAARISPLEASGRIAASEATTAGIRFGIFQGLALLIGTLKVIGWVGGGSLTDFSNADWVGETDRALDFISFPLFVYGITTLVASRRRLMSLLEAPTAWLMGGSLRKLSLHHMETSRHRSASFLLIVGLMSSLSLYPTVMTAVFDNKSERGARVQLGGELQITLHALDLMPAAAQAKGGLKDRARVLRKKLIPLVERLRALDGVQNADYIIEGLVEGLYMPGRGFSGVPIYLIDNPRNYLKTVYHEPALGESAPFTELLGRLDNGEALLSTSVARFYKREIGAAMPMGRDTSGAMVKIPLGGVVRFLPGMPLRTVNDREGFVAARIDYINYLFAQSPYLISSIDKASMDGLDVLMPRVVISIKSEPGITPARLRAVVLGALDMEPLGIREIDDEISRLGSDMYIFLARQNVQIYLFGGLLLAIIGILAVAYSNYLENRRTLVLLRVRGGGPGHILRFFAPSIFAPSLIGLTLGFLVALVVGFGITDVVWDLRQMQTILNYLPTRLVLSGQTVTIAAFLVMLLLGIAVIFSRWVFRNTAREGLSEG